MFLWKFIKTTAPIRRGNILGYLSPDIICPEKLATLEENCHFEEQIMFKDKYPSIFLCLMVAIVLIIATRAVLKIGEYGNIQTRDVFKAIAHKRKYFVDYRG